jgi:hypothetical protein
MRIDLTVEEKIFLLRALGIAQYFFEKLNQLDDAARARQLHELLGYADLEVNLDVESWAGTPKAQQIMDVLKKREAMLQGGGKVVELYRPQLIDEDDPDEVSADREFARVARQWARDMKGKNDNL